MKSSNTPKDQPKQHKTKTIVYALCVVVCFFFAKYLEHFMLYMNNAKLSDWTNNTATAMTGEHTTRYMESRPSRSNIHLLHPMKTDEIEVLESGAINSHHTNIGNGIADRNRTKVSKLYWQKLQFVPKFVCLIAK